MVFQVTCRGFAVAQFMQPEPTKYAHVPTLAGTHFMLPEEPFFTHHPGRFFYVRDDETGEFFSAPYEPTRVSLERYEFSQGIDDISWTVEKWGIRFRARVWLPQDWVVEAWEVEVENLKQHPRRVSLYPYFPVGYSSWMNMSAGYHADLNGVVATRVAPYQRLEDHFKRAHFKDLTFLVSETSPDGWESNQAHFEGEGSLANPDALRAPVLDGQDCHHEVPACVLQFTRTLQAGQIERLGLLFGAAKDHAEINQLRRRLFGAPNVARERQRSVDYVRCKPGCLTITTPDDAFNHFVNHWLPRQLFYHGDTNRLTTDPQTRNYLQDAMGMVFIDPAVTRRALLTLLSQQSSDGALPDGVLLTPDAELKYINQIPHMDHPVWLPICLSAYLNETADWALLSEPVPFADKMRTSVFDHVCRALDWLIRARDARGLSFIGQGDWCDPMNMVGYKGRGVSGWLSQAVAYALQLSLPMCRHMSDPARAEAYTSTAEEIKAAVNEYLWDGDWYARGITDDDVVFGVGADLEGRIFLNPQSFGLLAGIADDTQQERILAAVRRHLVTPHGVQLLAPPYTRMRDDVGRVTQKFPGAAENGSIYNHAAAFYAAALYQCRRADDAFDVLRRMIAGLDDDDLRQRGQTPTFIPNYYRGAVMQFPRTAGRSSQLFNTGTAAWFYRLVVEQLVGLRGQGVDLIVDPLPPAHVDAFRATRRFQGSVIELNVQRVAAARETQVYIDGEVSLDRRLRSPEAGRRYRVEVLLPLAQ